MDEFSILSQKRFAAAQEAGRFDAELAPVELKSKKGSVMFEKDEHPRPDTTLEGFKKLPKVFKKDGVIHAGAASRHLRRRRRGGDGHPLVGREEGRQAHRPLVNWAIAGCDPKMMGIGPAPAIRKLLERAEFKLATSTSSR